jgi:heme/copper-type cytochrome/quinol oxidase subunit 3
MSLHESKPGFPPTPRGMQTVGMLLFLAALFMLFAAMMMAYVFIRISGPHHAQPHTVHLPQLLWVSTAFILGVSICFHGALKAVQRERQTMMRRWLALSLACAVGFICVQIPALWQLLEEHFKSRSQSGILLYGLLFIFILLHALHVLGGMFALIAVVRRGFKGRYDHEHHYGLSTAAMYWHFLDAVWLAMFAIFWLLG